MVLCAASLLVLPEPLVFFQTIDRRGIRIVIVKVPDLLRDTRMPKVALVVGSWKLIWVVAARHRFLLQPPVPV